MHTCGRLARHRCLPGRLVDVLADGAALCDTTGRVTDRNPALGTLLVADTEARRLDAEGRDAVAATVGAVTERRS